MVNVERLRFARARGARLQWQDTNRRWYNFDSYEYGNLNCWSPKNRIHPDDAHLEYGPISSALRERVISGSEKYPVYDPYLQMGLQMVSNEYDFGADMRVPNGPHSYRMFMLFVAEYLADEGL